MRNHIRLLTLTASRPAALATPMQHRRSSTSEKAVAHRHRAKGVAFIGGLRRFGAGLIFALVGAVGAFGAFGSAGAHAQPSGTVIAVVQQAEVNRATGKKVLQPRAPVYSGDQIVTGGTGLAQITFRDDTKLVVGPNAKMVIDAFVLNEDNTAREISVNAVRGAFRFITGNSSKDVYKITTPTATVGIRG